MDRSAPFRVLLVDDYAISRRMFAIGLSHAGIEVHEAEDAAGALAAARAARFDVVVVDVFLGRDSGLDLARAMLADPACAPRAVVAMSGHRGQEIRDRAVDAGCAAYVLKPCDADRLLQVIESVLGRGGRPAHASNL